MNREQSPTRAEIISMAQEAGLFTHKEVQPELERFAALIASRVAAAAKAEEREACAKVCAEMFSYGALEVATAIRARGETSSRGQA
jgi:hypothetical protein